MNSKTHIIAGGAGFIGYNLSRKILTCANERIWILDDLSNPVAPKKLKEILEHPGVTLLKADLSSWEETKQSFITIQSAHNINDSVVWHLAANSDIQAGVKNWEIDFQKTFRTTHNLLGICREIGISEFAFASSSAVYGDHGDRLLTEGSGPLMPISYYGAMKLASEAACFAARDSYLKKLRVFRFPNVVGQPATHGVIFDFIKKIKANPGILNVLGNGKQKKSYLHVEDLVDGMLYLNSTELIANNDPIFNLGPVNDDILVSRIAEIVVSSLGTQTQIMYGDSPGGWPGDVPRFKYDTSKAESYGWRPTKNSEEAVKLATKEIIRQIDQPELPD